MPSPDVKPEDEQKHVEIPTTAHNPAPPPEEEEDDEELEEEEEEDDDDEEEDEDEEEDLNFTSPSISIPDPKLPILEQTPPPPPIVDQKLQLTPTQTPIEEKKPPTSVSVASDESRKLFQRLWTDEDEIGLLQGYLDFTIQRGGYHNSSYHHDTGPFYDQIKTRLQLDFNKNQLVEKLRRLKKKYRNVVTRASTGKEVSFKTPHDQATYEIARKIWGDGSSSSVGGKAGGGLQEDVGIDDEEGNPLNSNANIDVKPNLVNVEKKVLATPRRSQKRAAETELPNMPKFRGDSSTMNTIEETVRSCLSPVFKELINCATNGACNLGGLGGVGLNPMPMNFGGNSSMNFGNGEKLDERWRKQQILELEVYSKRIELVQDQIKSTLEDLRSVDK